MSRASTPTLLSLARYASLIGIPPVHFSGGFADTVWTLKGVCEEVWPQYAWQKDQIASREDLAQAIGDAEEEIARHLGYWPAPKWITAEEYLWPRPGYNLYNLLRARWGKIISPGRRATTLIDADATVTFSDPDDDDWDELATITANTTVTDPKEIKIYFAGHADDPIWEIRPVRSITIASGVVTILLDSWLLIDPVLWEQYPTANEFIGINVTTTDNYVAEVAIYREYVDTTVSVEHYWLPGSGSGACLTEEEAIELGCDRTVEDGCFAVAVANTGVIRPSWSSYPVNGYPAGGKLWYLAGEQSERYLSGYTLDPLSEYWSQAIVWLATARLELTPCSCGPAQAYFDLYRRDLAFVGKDRARQIVTQDLINTSAFGTRFGEVKAWERVSKFNLETNMFKGAAI